MSDFELVDRVDASGKILRCSIIFGLQPEVTAKTVRNIVNLPVRDDDVILVTPPKSGIFIGY